jgi:F-type H+-transporting ATPase subunit epsilon
LINVNKSKLFNKTEHLAVAGGFAEVTGTKVTIVAEAAELGKEIDVERARRARERAERRLAAAKTELIDWNRAEAALRRAMVRTKVAAR